MPANAQEPAFVPPPPRTGGRFGTAAAALTGGVWAVVWLSAASAGAWAVPSPAIVVLTLLPWVALGLVAWTFFLWNVAPDHPATGWLFGLSVVAPLLQWGPSWPARPDTGTDGAPLRVLTWNVRRLWGAPGDGGDATACVLDALRAASPDVILLQEVSTAELDRIATPLALDCAHGAYRAYDAPTSAGLAVCTAGDRWTHGPAEIRPFTADDAWRYVRTVVTDGSHDLDVLAVHLLPYRLLHDPVGALPRAMEALPETAAGHLRQADALLAALGDPDRPAIVGGDFNAARDTPVHAHLRRVLVDALERGASGWHPTVRVLDRLPLRIDYVYATPALGVVDAAVPAVGCSDHRPIVTDLRVPASGGGRQGPR